MSRLYDLEVEDLEKLLDQEFGKVAKAKVKPRWTAVEPVPRVDARERWSGADRDATYSREPLTDAEVDAMISRALAETALLHRSSQLWREARRLDPSLPGTAPWLR